MKNMKSNEQRQKERARGERESGEGGERGERKGSESEMTREMLKLLTGVEWMQLWRVECMWTAGGTYV